MINHTRCLATLLAAMLLATLAPASLAQQADESDAARAFAPDPRAVEIRFTDGSNLRAHLADERIDFTTKHGKLSIPADQIKRIYFAQRLDEKTQNTIEQAIAALADPATADAAEKLLFRLGAQAYPALKRVAEHEAPTRATPASERSAELVKRMEKQQGDRLATLRDTDLMETANGKLVGHMTAATLPIQTKQFGPLTMNLADVVSLRSQALAQDEPKPEPEDVLPDPGNMKGYEGMVGKTLRFEVTGRGGSCWGTDVYTADSKLAAAAVHAGVLKLGETAIVQVKIIPPPPGFTGSSRNGITTNSWGQYPGAYEIIKPKKR
jgi:hypothetical protein